MALEFRPSAVVVLASLLLAGCGDVAFEKVRPVTDATADAEVMSSRGPCLVLFHSGLSTNGAWTWGEPLERMARVFGDDLPCFQYDREPSGAWARSMGIRMTGTPILFDRGRKVADIGTYMPEEAGRIAQLFAMVDAHAMPNQRFGGYRGAVELQAKFFQSDVLEAERPVVIAFDRCSGGG